jgi:hypothetical protein
VHRSDKLPHACLANSTYAESMGQAKSRGGTDGWQSVPEGAGSIERFVRTAARIDGLSNSTQDIVDYAFGMLDGVNQGYDLDSHSTVWSIVYDIGEKRVLFRTHNHREIRRIDFATLKFDCSQPVPVWDILEGGEGDITGQWRAYSRDLNGETARKNVTHPAIIQAFGDMSPLLEPVISYTEKFTSCEE